MAAKFRRVLVPIAIGLLIAAGPIALLDYFLPHHAVYGVVGTEVKRVAQDGTSVFGQQTAGVRDVRYIYAEEIETRKPHVFRNEDTGWGFPWYFKFNSADIQAAAQSIAAEHGTAALTYYGWRIKIFSMFPNVTKIARAEPGAWTIPWFNIAFFTLAIGGSVWLFLRIRGVLNRRRLAREAAPHEARTSR
jgi:Protein of unknown function (DUF1523)